MDFSKKRILYSHGKFGNSIILAYGSEDKKEEEEEKNKQTIPNVYDNPVGHATSTVNNSDSAALATLGASIAGGMKGAAAAAAAVAPAATSGPMGLVATGLVAGGGFVTGGLSAGAGAYGTAVAYQCAGCHLGNDGDNYVMEPQKDD